MFAQLISDARAAEYELVEPGDEDRLFYRLPWWKKIIVMAGGPMTNLVIAFLLFAVVFMGHGVRTADHRRSPTSPQCVIAVTKANADQPQRACTAERPGRAGQGGRPAARRPDRRRSTARRSTTGTQLHDRDPRQRRRRGHDRRAPRRAATSR